MSWLSDTLGGVGNALYKATPLDNIVNAYGYARRGDWGDFGKQIGLGLLDTALILGTGGAGRGVSLIGKEAGQSGFRQAVAGLARTTGFGSKEAAGGLGRLALTKLGLGTAGRFRAPIIAGFGTIGAHNIGSMVNFGRGLFSGEDGNSKDLKDAQVRAQGYRQMINAVNQMGGSSNYGLGVGMVTPQTSKAANNTGTTGGNVTPPATGGQANINTNYNFGAGNVLPGLNPMLQAQLDKARSDALLQMQQVQNEIDLQRRMGSMEAQRGYREAGRSSSTGAADLRSLASELGFGSSPAAYGVGLDQIAAEEARRRAAIAAELAAQRETLRRRGASATSEYRSILDRLNMEEAAARSQASLSNIMQNFGV